MVKISVKFSGGSDPKTWLQEKVDKLDAENREVMTESIEEGAQLMKEYISTRGTAKSGKQGRIDTARMVGAVNSVVRERTRDTWRGAFGWVSDREDYFIFQEEGFTHYQSGEKVEAMYAKQDAGEYIWDRVVAGIEENIRGA